MYMTLGKTLVRVIRYLLSIKKVPKKDTKTYNFLFKKGRFWDLFGSKRIPKRQFFIQKRSFLGPVWFEM